MKETLHCQDKDLKHNSIKEEGPIRDREKALKRASLHKKAFFLMRVKKTLLQ
jgi:hypothetical protein